MSVYANLDTGEQEQVATIAGWGDFGKWVDGLAVKDSPEVIRIREHGWSQELGDLESQLAKAVADHSPGDADTADVADVLLRFVRARPATSEAMVMSNGMTPERA